MSTLKSDKQVRTQCCSPSFCASGVLMVCNCPSEKSRSSMISLDKDNLAPSEKEDTEMQGTPSTTLIETT